MSIPFPKLTAEEAAALIKDKDVVGFSAFTSAGAPKTISRAIAEKAKAEHAAGKPFQIGSITGASTGPSLDGALAGADAVAFRTPFQSDSTMRKAINDGKVQFIDMHLSGMAHAIRTGQFGKVNWAVIEAADIDPDGSIVLTSSVGNSVTLLRMADKVLIELNRYHPKELRGIHDIYEPLDPPYRLPIPITSPGMKVGEPVVRVDPSKIVGYVESNLPDEVGSFSEVSEVTGRIGKNVAEFLAAECKSGKIPSSFLPVQSGVGDIANAVLGAMGEHPDIPSFDMYSEVLQDSAFKMIQSGKIRAASSVAITATKPMLQEIYGNLDFYRNRFVLRPQQITNSPEVIRRLGVIAMNTAIEADIFGNVNSTHFFGRTLMNGIGGSGDFTRNSWVSIFTCPSTQKDGKISTIVPQVSHLDHNEHSVGVIVTEHGVADLRGKSPSQRARIVIEKCAAPEYRELLHRYVSLGAGAHTPSTLSKMFALHQAFQEQGDMRLAKL